MILILVIYIYNIYLIAITHSCHVPEITSFCLCSSLVVCLLLTFTCLLLGRCGLLDVVHDLLSEVVDHRLVDIAHNEVL